ncbi:hypothetical protein DM860_017823 [Cuscuta australis]|uniref:NAC domain-containing protein n=1 Tax=Cuscuta australis TaxID=267555 RepID=A0A328DXU0_9ASTE|nr:hypothetical protein DM860_017823 [Cuscuta australis]
MDSNNQARSISMESFHQLLGGGGGGYEHLDSCGGGCGWDANLPPGFRFHPTDEELITYYLLKKVVDSSFAARAIAEVDLNKCEPWELPEKAMMGEKEWYFFSLRDRKYPTGLRTNRATEAGYWKATGKDREIYSSKTCALVGMKKTLVFYRGRAPKGEKTNWVMHEYRLDGKFAYHYFSRASKDEWVISRVFQKSGAAPASATAAGKRRLTADVINLYPDVSSPSSVSLPPLVDSSSYNNHNTATSAPTAESCSYDEDAVVAKEHVPCFSNSLDLPAALPPLGSKFTSLLDLPLVPSSLSRFAAIPRTNNNNGEIISPSAFPCLRSLHENLQLPFFIPGAPPLHGGLADQMGGYAIWPPVAEPQKVGNSELDCMWTY